VLSAALAQRVEHGQQRRVVVDRLLLGDPDHDPAQVRPHRRGPARG
jgi:hypothetical protein